MTLRKKEAAILRRTLTSESRLCGMIMSVTRLGWDILETTGQILIRDISGFPGVH